MGVEGTTALAKVLPETKIVNLKCAPLRCFSENERWPAIPLLAIPLFAIPLLAFGLN